jgi:hypothetical protein
MRKVQYVVGRIVEQKANCACGSTEGFDLVGQICPVCKTPVLDILCIVDIETSKPAVQDDDGSIMILK